MQMLRFITLQHIKRVLRLTVLQVLCFFAPRHYACVETDPVCQKMMPVLCVSLFHDILQV